MRNNIFISLFGRAGQRLAIMFCVGAILFVAGISWTDLMFWCFLAMIFLVEFLGHQQGMADGIMIMHYATPEQRAQIQNMIRELERQNEPTDSSQ